MRLARKKTGNLESGVGVSRAAHDLLSSIEHVLSKLAGSRIAAGLSEFLVFGFKQAAACVFAGSFLFLLAISSHVSIPGLARYDFLFLGAIAIQIVLVALRLENWREVAVLSLFHLIGVGLSCLRPRPPSDRGAILSRHFFT